MSDSPSDRSQRRRDGRELTYSEYIHVPALLRAQRLPEEIPRGRSRDEWPERPSVADPSVEGGQRPWREGDRWPNEWPHDELLFIVTHQTFELWFRQLLHDLDDVMHTAQQIVSEHGGHIPPADLLAREPESAPALRDSLARYPRTAKVIDEQLSQHPWERAFAQQLHEPACFPARDSALCGAVSLAWFDDATLDRFAQRVGRAGQIIRHATGAFAILETMPPESFLSFRSRLDPASGFGSTQFREVEMLIGLKDVHRARLAATGELSFRRHMPQEELDRMEQRMREPSLRDLLYALLNARELRGDDAHLSDLADTAMSENLKTLHSDFESARMRWGDAQDVESALHNQWRNTDEILQHAENVQLAHMYRSERTRPALRALFERTLELDQALTAWRNVHIAMVERVIGARPGTGGGGLQYLRKTLIYRRAAPCLWEFRSTLLR
ncbi:MAG: tryptophan 2,3-dioxygenase family protein [Deltaproteobacteria bacterium]|nr:tryptophan 2,3-dioxygenase family protein [Deltaproteobacteria bacterium]